MMFEDINDEILEKIAGAEASALTTFIRNNFELGPESDPYYQSMTGLLAIFMDQDEIDSDRYVEAKFLNEDEAEYDLDRLLASLQDKVREEKGAVLFARSDDFGTPLLFLDGIWVLNDRAKLAQEKYGFNFTGE